MTITGDSRRRSARSILIAHANRSQLHSIGAQLGALGYLVVLAETGREALDRIAGHVFDLVLIDADVPCVSGLDLLAELRSAPETADLAVILMTGTQNSRSAIAALSAGADDHVTRPFDVALLHARIGRTLERADRIAELKRRVSALDARVAARAIELGEARHELALQRSEHVRSPGPLIARAD